MAKARSTAKDPSNVDYAYYGSRNPSVINNRNAVNRRGRVGDPVAAHPTPEALPGDTSTDKYYRNGGSVRGKPRTAAVPAPRHNPKKVAAGEAYADTPGVVKPLFVHRKEKVIEAVDRIVGLLVAGQTTVVVQVASAELELNVRDQLDLRVAREQITHDQKRDVRFGLIPKDNAAVAEEMVGKLDPAAVPLREADEPLPDDFDAFVKGSGSNVVVVETEAGKAIGTPAALKNLAKAAPNFGAPADDDSDDSE